MKEVSITARRELIATLADLTKTLKHDFRLEDDDERTNENIRPEYSCDNVQFINRDITRDNVSTVMVDFINNLPQNKEVVDEYNQKQLSNHRRTRVITNLASKISERGRYTRNRNRDGEQYPVAQEWVFAIDNINTLANGSSTMFMQHEDYYNNDEWRLRKEAISNFADKLPDLLPEFEIFSMSLHLDEGNPHMHVITICPARLTDRGVQCSTNDATIKNALSLNLDVNPLKDKKGIYELKYNSADAFAKLRDHLDNALFVEYQNLSPEPVARKLKKKDKFKITNKELKKIHNEYYKKPIDDAINLIQSLSDLNNKLISILTPEQLEALNNILVPDEHDDVIDSLHELSDIDDMYIEKQADDILKAFTDIDSITLE